VLAAPIRRGKMPSELHQEARKALRDSEVQSIPKKHCPKALRNQRMLCRPKASLGRRPGLRLCLVASAARSCLSARCFCTCCFNFSHPLPVAAQAAQRTGGSCRSWASLSGHAPQGLSGAPTYDPQKNSKRFLTSRGYKECLHLGVRV